MSFVKKTKQQLKGYFESQIFEFLQVASAIKYSERLFNSKITIALVSLP